MMPILTKFFILILFSTLNGHVLAQNTLSPPNMTLPIDCEIGWNCWITGYVDHDSGPKKRDYRCGQQTIDKHRGTDFMIRNHRDMQGGVVVRAAADGVVLGMRDGMKDIDYRKRDRARIHKKECGNGLRIKHKNGWITHYCHLKKNSVKVEKGQQVKAGDQVGLVGNSGLAKFPHLHFQVEYIAPSSQQRRGAIVDPFVGPSRNDQCESSNTALWSKQILDTLKYEHVSIVDMGFSSVKPKLDGIVEGFYDDETLSIRSPRLYVWARLLDVKQGDKVTFSITDPDGNTVMTYSSTIKKNQPMRALFSGAERPTYSWDSGVYIGHVKLVRQTDGENGGIFQQETRVNLR